MAKTSNHRKTSAGSKSAFRLRLGVLIWLLSWLPFASISSYFIQKAGGLQSSEAAHEYLVVVWTVQICLGFVGLLIAGKETIGLIKVHGLKKAPAQIWRLLLNKPPKIKADGLDKSESKNDNSLKT